MMVAFPLIGHIADRANPRNLLIGLSMFSGISTICLAFAKRWEIIAILLTLFYLNWTMVPVANRYLSKITPPEALNRTFTTVHSGFALSMIFLPALGAWLANVRGMPFVFTLSAALLLLCIVPALFLQEPEQSRMVDLQEPRATDFFKDNLQLLAFIPIALMCMRTGQYLLPNYLSEVLKLDKLAVGQLGTIAAAGGMVFTLLLGRLAAKKSLSALVIAISIGLGLILMVPHGGILVGAFFLIGSIEAFFPLISALIAAAAPLSRSGFVFGVQGTLVGVSIILATWLAGILYDVSPKMPILFSVITLPLSLLWVRRLRMISGLSTGYESSNGK